VRPTYTGVGLGLRSSPLPGRRELRRDHRGDVRVSYWLAPGRRVVLLTVFAKTRQRERAEAARAIAAQRACERGHAAGHPDHGLARGIYERKWD
jgi:hypothetical protein